MYLNIVIVDDTEINLTLFKHLVARVGDVTPHTFASSAAALDWCKTHRADVIVVDYMMPSPDGIEFTRQLRQHPDYADVPVVMVTASDLKEVRYAALEAGATDFLTKPVDKTEFITRLRNMADLRRSQRYLADQAAHLADQVAHATTLIEERERETIFRLARAAEYRDPETGAHILRMAHYSKLMAIQLGVPVDERALLFEAAPMHDIGKVGTPDGVLLKPGRLTPEEFEIMKQHARIGHEILKDSTSPILQMAATIALSHHEKFDGTGYPAGLAGSDIPLMGRIVAVADVFDALTSERPYKPAWEIERATALLREQSGKHFDPVCIDAFFAVWPEILAIHNQYRDEPLAENQDNPLSIH
jgi:putative two-component system response regulator